MCRFSVSKLPCYLLHSKKTYPGFQLSDKLTQKFQVREKVFVEQLGGLIESKLADIGKINFTTTTKAYPDFKSFKNVVMKSNSRLMTKC